MPYVTICNMLSNTLVIIVMAIIELCFLILGSILLPQSLLTKGSIEEILSSQKVIGENVEKLKNEQPKDAEPVNDGEIESLVDDVPEVTDDIDVDDLIIKMGVVG